MSISKTVNAVATEHVWDEDQIAFEMDGTGVVINKYIRGINLMASENGSGTRNFYLYNGHGDVVKLANSSGNVVKSYDYDAFATFPVVSVNCTTSPWPLYRLYFYTSKFQNIYH